MAHFVKDSIQRYKKKLILFFINFTVTGTFFFLFFNPSTSASSSILFLLLHFLLLLSLVHFLCFLLLRFLLLLFNSFLQIRFNSLFFFLILFSFSFFLISFFCTFFLVTKGTKKIRTHLHSNLTGSKSPNPLLPRVTIDIIHLSKTHLRSPALIERAPNCLAKSICWSVSELLLLTLTACRHQGHPKT